MIKKLTSGYYSKMMLISISTVCAITALLFILSSSMIRNQEKSEYLKNYDIAVSNLSSILTTKQNSLANTLAPVFSSPSRYQALCSLYKKHPTIAYSTNRAIIQMLKEICRYDQYCRGVLLATNEGELFQYNTSSDTLIPLTLNKVNFNFTPYQLQILSDSQLEALCGGYEKPADHVYGLSGTIFDYTGDNLATLGQIIILYSTAEFTNSLSTSHLDPSATFTLTDTDRNILFSSDGNYEYTKGILTAEQIPSGSSTIQMPVVSRMLNGKSYYFTSVYNGHYEFFANYQLPAGTITRSFTQVILAVLAVIICAASILLYVITLRIADKKIKTIQKGMNLVGQNNLDYRLPVPDNNDEFTQITNSFNRMCDELQHNIEKAYLFEISQKKAELYAMQTSINPHFLYNALEQIRVQITQGKYSDASQMLLLLSKMYRNQTRRTLYVSIGEELNLCENLINLYMYRYGNFDYEFFIGNALKIYGIPKNTLQPLIENYFVHGMVLDRDDNMLTISIQSVHKDDKDWLEFSIEDNGASITPEELKTLEEKLSQPVLSRDEDNGFALSNVNSRLKLVFGEESRLHPQVGSQGKGFRIVFAIPPVLPEDLQ